MNEILNEFSITFYSNVPEWETLPSCSLSVKLEKVRRATKARKKTLLRMFVINGMQPGYQGRKDRFLIKSATGCGS